VDLSPDLFLLELYISPVFIHFSSQWLLTHGTKSLLSLTVLQKITLLFIIIFYFLLIFQVFTHSFLTNSTIKNT
jgi:hypothetical protein